MSHYNNNPLIERQLNAPVPGHPLRFLTQISPKNPDAPFSLEIPAQVITGGGAFGGGVTPVGRILLDGHPAPSACVSASVLDETSLTSAAARLEASLGSGLMTAAAIRLEAGAGAKSFADFVGLAAHAGCGCGCGGASVEGALRLGASNTKGGALHWSDPVPASLNVKSGNDGIETELFANTDGFIYRDCDEDWYWKGWFQCRFTLCEGICKDDDAGKICTCGTKAQGFPRRCPGWVGCTCVERHDPSGSEHR